RVVVAARRQGPAFGRPGQRRRAVQAAQALPSAVEPAPFPAVTTPVLDGGPQAEQSNRETMPVPRCSWGGPPPLPPPPRSRAGLAQRLAQKQSELEQVRQAYQARSTELARRRDDLLAQLRAVQAEIEAVRAPAAATAPAPAAAPPAPAPPAAARGALTLPALL